MPLTAKKKPQELSEIWDKETKTAWGALKPKYQDFFVKWLSNGNNASKAYWDVVDKMATSEVARACGYRMLTNAHIQKICEKLSQDRASDLVLIKKTYKDGMLAETPIFADGEKVMDIEDHKTRIAAAEKLAKINGELIDKVAEVDTDGKSIVDRIRKRMNEGS